MYGDLGKGIGDLVAMGVVFMVILVLAIPPAVLFGLAWLLEPRLGDWVWVLAKGSTIVWPVVCYLIYRSWK